MGFYEYFAKQPKRQEDFNDGMSSSSILLLRELLKKYTGFKGIATLVDVGGGNGATLRAILAEYPSIKGINFDQPQVIANAPSCPGKFLLKIILYCQIKFHYCILILNLYSFQTVLNLSIQIY